MHLSDSQNNLISEARQGLPVFSYQVCLFKFLKKKNPKIKLFSGGAYIASAAAIEANIETYYLSHGLVDRAIPFTFRPSTRTHFISLPEFDYIYLYSNDEIKYYKKYGVVSKLCLYPQHRTQTKERKVIFFTNPSHDCWEEKSISDAIELFAKHGYQILVKFHPSYTSDLNKNIIDREEVKIFNALSKAGSEVIAIENPEFVCSFASTTLSEALSMGVMPICLSSNKKITFEINHLYPFKRRTLFWEDEKSVILECLQDSSRVKAGVVLKKLCDESQNLLP